MLVSEKRQYILIVTNDDKSSSLYGLFNIDKLRTGCCMCIASLNRTVLCGVSTMLVPIIQVRKREFRDVHVFCELITGRAGI